MPGVYSTISHLDVAVVRARDGLQRHAIGVVGDPHREVALVAIRVALAISRQLVRVAVEAQRGEFAELGDELFLPRIVIFTFHK